MYRRRWLASAGCTRAMCVRLKRMREATALRARSMGLPARRPRPPRPKADASSPAMKSSSARARHASLVVAALGVFELAVQIRQPFPVVRPCPAVEDGVSGNASGCPEPLGDELRGGGAARVGRRARGGGDQVRDVDLLARIGEQDRDVAEALAVPQADGRTGVREGPEVSLVATDRLAMSLLLRIGGRA